MIILITGGASGLGEAITRKLALNQEDKIYLTYAHSKQKALDLESDFPNVTALKCDFSDSSDLLSLAEQIAIIQPDALINNAYSGTFIGTHFHKTETSDFLAEFQINVLSTISITQAAIQVFQKKKFGKIITILSSALVGNPPVGAAIYVANKAYLQKLAMVWANENARFNITSNCISPSFMETEFTSDMDERLIEQIKENHPLKNLLQTSEVADSVAYFIGASQQINATDLVINAASSIK